MSRRPRASSYERDYRRRESVREPYDYVLIVCEGEKTEPIYLRGLTRLLSLSSANVRVVSPDGSDPMTLVNAARKALVEEEFYRVYCVFDRDRHTNYDQAVDNIRNSSEGRAGRLIATTSVPCFEVWVLLHFVYTAQTYDLVQGRSVAGPIIREIQKYYPEYTKAGRGTFTRLQHHLDEAIRHGARLEAENRGTGSTNPATDMHRLVEYLKTLREKVLTADSV